MLIKNGFLFFWKTEDIYSQWHPSEFTVFGVMYANAEQYMMAAKARIFNDLDTLNKILQTDDPRQMKKLGREVRNFDGPVWDNGAYAIVYQGNVHKFMQNKNMAQSLMDTDDLILVEASPVDTIWGIGLAEDNPDAIDPSKWQGKNLLGNALMDVRTILLENCDGTL